MSLCVRYTTFSWTPQRGSGCTSRSKSTHRTASARRCSLSLRKNQRKTIPVQRWSCEQSLDWVTLLSGLAFDTSFRIRIGIQHFSFFGDRSFSNYFSASRIPPCSFAFEMPTINCNKNGHGHDHGIDFAATDSRKHRWQHKKKVEVHSLTRWNATRSMLKLAS